MFQKKINEINYDDIIEIIGNQLLESRTLDYKEKYSIQNDHEKKNFLADVSAFANTLGGYIIYGIQERRDENGKQTGLPEKAIGLSLFNPDEEKRRIEGILRDSLAPRLSGFSMHHVDGFKNGPIFILHIPQSWSAPHMITFQGSQKFYSRGNAMNYLMDVVQIRSSFILSEGLQERIRKIHQDCIEKTSNKSTPIEITGSRKLIMNFIPLVSLRGNFSIDISEMKKNDRDLDPISKSKSISLCCQTHSRINLGGYLKYAAMASNNSETFSYCQAYRNGIIELVDGYVLNGWEGLNSLRDGDKYPVPTAVFEKNVINTSQQIFNFLIKIGIEGPVVISMTLLGVQNVQLAVYNNQYDKPHYVPNRFDRNLLMLPEIIVNDLNSESDKIMKPIFDAFYNAAGWDKCVHYDDQGRWQD